MMGRYKFYGHDGPGKEELQAILSGITKTMQETRESKPDNFLRDQNQTPGSGSPGSPERRGTGWAEPAPLSSPPYQEVIERLVDQAFPQSPEAILKSAKLTPELVEELKKMIEADPTKLGWIGEMLERVDGKTP
jgi:hypothetical protein